MPYNLFRLFLGSHVSLELISKVPGKVRLQSSRGKLSGGGGGGNPCPLGGDWGE